jgi:hypothetical protein
MLKNRSNQKDTGLGYNGMSNGSSQKPSAPAVMVNKHTGHMNDGRDVNVGMKSAARTGNGAGKTAGATAPHSGGMGTKFSNPDSINVGSGPRNAGGTRAFMPSGGQNFKGDPDKIQMTQMPNRTGNKC